MEERQGRRPHAVCIPLPAQGHINPMFKLAKLLHSTGFYITFVHTEFNYQKLITSANSNSLNQVQNFRFQTVSDGLPSTNTRGILDLPALVESMPLHTLNSFRNLIKNLTCSSSDSPPVTCIISDGVMSFILKVAQEFNIPGIVFFTVSACGMLGYLQFQHLLEEGYFPLKDESYLDNGYLDTTIDWTPSIGKIRLRDLPTFIRTTNRDDLMFNYNLESIKNALKAGSLILNTFDDLEHEALDILRSKFPNLYTVGPLSLLAEGSELHSLGSSLWKEDEEWLKWLDAKEAKSVVYVNFGSLVIMSPHQLKEFAWGLANSNYFFLWVIRPDLVNGGRQVIKGDLIDEIEGRGLILDWVPQEKLICHPSIGGFLTHCGWNSVLESISHGVPMLCWPFFAEQQMNCLYMCTQWGVGMEIDCNVERGEVERVVRELMQGEKGFKMRKSVMEWNKRAEKATKNGGSSSLSFDLLVKNLNGGITINRGDS